MRQIDKLPLPVKSAPGFLVNRVLAPYLMAAMRCVDEGIAPETVDEAALAFGMPMGPIELADTVGLDICVAVGRMLTPDAPPPKKLMALVEAGHLGRKSKRGFYDYASGKPAKSAPGVVPPGLADRLVGPFVAEAKAALAEGIVADADLVDAGAIFGTGFAPFRGGPLHDADGGGRAAGLARPDPARCGRTSHRASRPPRRDDALGVRFRCGLMDERPRVTAPGTVGNRHGKRGRRSAHREEGSLVERIWLKQYPKGVPAEIDVNEFASLREVLRAKHGQVCAPRPAYTCMGKTITFSELDTLSAAFGAWLQANGCRKGARVALMMPNILQYPVCLFGILRAGCTVVNVNPLYTARELEHQLKDSGAEVIVVVENFAHTVAEVVGKTKVRQVVVTSIGEMLGFKGLIVDFVLRHVKKMVPPWSLPGSVRLSDALADGRKAKLERVPLAHDDIAFLQYTGGTTGVAKGAMLLHRNIVANLLQARAWVRPFLGPEGREIIITPLPLYHIFSLTANCLTFMTLGARQRADPQSARHPGIRQGDGEVQVHGVHRRQHAVQRARQQRRIREARLLGAADHAGRRDGGAGGGRVRVEGSHRPSADRGLRSHRDVARGDDQPARPAGLQRLDRPADPVDRTHSAR